jgi:3-oxoacyl-[acyl-carrier-protein] synthase II
MSAVAITGAAVALDGADEGLLDGLPEEVRARALRAERVTQLAIAAAGGALAEAGAVALDGEPRPECGVALGTAFGCFLTNAAYQRRLAADGPRAASPRLFAATVSNAAAGELSIGYRLGGPAITLTAGGAAGLLAIGHAADLVAAGRARVMVAGGVDASGPALERWLADGGLPAGEAPVREGAAIVVLEPGGTARGGRRGTILGHGAGFSPPAGGDGGGVSAAIAQALDDARLRPADVALVALEGTPAATEPARRVLRAAIGRAVPAPAARPSGRAERFAAGGPLALLATLAEAAADAPCLVLHVCASGHAAAMVVVKPGGA